MVIRTMKENYSVIKTLEGSSKLRAYLCCREEKPQEETFLVMAPNGQELSRKFLIYFMDLAQSRSAVDFVECFTKEGVVWVVFRYYGGTPFEEVFAEEYNSSRAGNGCAELPEERLCVGRSLMEQLFAQKLLPYLQYEATDLRNITVDESLCVHVNYLLYEPDLLEDDLFPLVLERLAICLQRLFAEELEDEVSKELYDYINMLRQNAFSEGTAVYRAYRRLEEQLRQDAAEGKLKPKGWLVRMWQKLIRVLEGFVKLLYAALLAGLLGLLIYVCIMPETAPEERNMVQSIGTLKITEYSTGELPEGETGTEHETY